MAVSILQLHSPIEFLVSRPARVIQGDTTIGEAGSIMLSEHLSAVLVALDSPAILTEGDLARAVAAECSADTPVSTIANPQPITVAASADVLESASLMLHHGVHHLVVHVPDRVLGIVSMREITAILLQAVKPDVSTTSVRLRVELPRSETFRP